MVHNMPAPPLTPNSVQRAGQARPWARLDDYRYDDDDDDDDENDCVCLMMRVTALVGGGGGGAAAVVPGSAVGDDEGLEYHG